MLKALFYYIKKLVGGDMPRARNPNREKAKDIYINHKGNIELVEIAKKLNIPSGTIRGWKNKDKWDNELNGTFPKDTERPKRKNESKSKPKLEKELEQLQSSDLNDKQRLFCIYYVKYFNATKAYQKAYGAEHNTSMVNGCKLLSKPKVADEIKRLKSEKLNGAFLEKEDILQKFIDIAFADITDYVEFGQKEQVVGKDDKGNPVNAVLNYIDFKESSAVDGTIISEVKKGRSGASIKLVDKMKALEFLAKHMGLLDAATKERLQIEQEVLELRKKELENKSW